ncbi:pinin/SDK/memA/ protein conserved region-domain-containing protein [Pseudomassariella vexata]|uniref:Pinin/SDK/memA/ protein conserved region-domain-containing protein n=1 Tax=Pseudomassariella vexata TaxID=1141098 RepID=A0A1Y2EFD0_9PEZI|nr:pinin/SDK/memA/ protein conserved region-domain-containing protein [Pseudomassariella vexata]ORY69505.1 pinin/SDK/memA/ protein conserved region-domain-containing protein [Pseudomassariella vexata]
MSAENSSLVASGVGPSATDAETHKESISALKRKASPPPEDAVLQSPKRTRPDNAAERRGSAGSPPSRQDPTTERRPQSSKEEERKRGKRLFGGLLNTLSQTTISSQQKKRQEIERRQQAKMQHQRAEDDKQRQEKLAKLNAVRKVEQVKFDEQVMQTRHSHMLATARFIHTKTEPKIYYLPWEPTADQEDIVKDQIRDAEKAVEKEAREFKQRKDEWMRALGVLVVESSDTQKPAPEPEAAHEETVGKSAEAPQTLTESTNPTSPAAHTTNSNKVGQEKESDETGDVMVEEEEDTVIY